jgi:hypothetical protein
MFCTKFLLWLLRPAGGGAVCGEDIGPLHTADCNLIILASRA